MSPQGGGGAIRIKLSLLSPKWRLRVSVATSKANKSALTFGMMGCGVISYHFMSRLRILPSQGVWHLQIYNYKPQQPRTTQQQPGYLCVCVCVSPSLQRSASQLYQPRVPGVQFRILQVSIKTDPTETPAHGNLNLTKSFYWLLNNGIIHSQSEQSPAGCHTEGHTVKYF